MNNIEHIHLTAKLLLQVVTIFGWFWLIMFTIYRFGCFKKRVFSFLIFIYFSRAIARISELISYDFDMHEKQWISMVVNFFTIFGFYILMKRLIFYQDKLKKLKQ